MEKVTHVSVNCKPNETFHMIVYRHYKTEPITGNIIKTQTNAYLNLMSFLLHKQMY